jgi:ribosomal-protein-alanine N-acetyltransferase
MSSVITTERFILRELRESDVSTRYLGWFSDPATTASISAAAGTHSLEDLREYLRARSGRTDVLFLGIFLRETNLHIGNIKYEPLDSVSGRAVMGILIGDPAFRGKGVAQEVLRASGAWLREHRGIRTISLGVHSANPAAVAAYERVGFQRINAELGAPADIDWFHMEWLL